MRQYISSMETPENQQKQLAQLQKQNEGMETSFLAKGIPFDKKEYGEIELEHDLSTLLEQVKTYNAYLKDISKTNRPKPKPEPKPTPATTEDHYDYDEEISKEVKPTFTTVTNMEDIKRSFFNKDYDTFMQLVKPHSFQYFTSTYKYSSDNNGRPEYVAKNLLRGFVQVLDDCRKYMMVCFRCHMVSRDPTEYTYQCYWIVNSCDPLQNILGPIYDDYEFKSVTEEGHIQTMLEAMKRTELTENDETTSTLVGEMYLH